jgi:S-adenosylmethionine synthetase
MYLWTSEAVSKGHPDKVADQIADAILDACLKIDPVARVASEVTILNDFVLLSGEIGSNKIEDVSVFNDVARRVICNIGYDRSSNSFDGNTCEILNKISRQSNEIAAAVVKNDGEIGAGDQGMMFGFATNETEAFMPLAHHLAFELIRSLEHDIAIGRLAQPGVPTDRWDSPLLPDAKTQVTMQYKDDGSPERIHTIVVSVCHKPNMTIGDVNGYVTQKAVKPLQKKYASLFDDQTRILINPAGLWNIGGPASDTGLSGRKIVVDNYGADCQIGGGSFSGKDPTKVDRSAAYAARHIAKNIVAAGLADAATVQISYAIGIVKPVAINVELKNGKVPSAKITQVVNDQIDLTPKGIIERLDLRRPIYSSTASGGHFGNPAYPWEKLDLVNNFKK